MAGIYIYNKDLYILIYININLNIFSNYWLEPFLIEIITFNLSNKIMELKFLINIKAINYIFLYKKHINIIYNILLIFLIRLLRAQYLYFFLKKDNLIIYIIYLNIIVFNYSKYFYFIIIINLGFYNKILK